ncbi:hypothetical protein NDU88_001612 [Pleurodeles waltl]|uniref:Uncharacterized protein n=1 Tax=Pleurodeles waltl TaxID=8319 RepID=A0AAV7MN70_PLEWA|nr:hypothetical protein NDU88_001612 [Pleurodeles waltl]
MPHSAAHPGGTEQGHRGGEAVARRPAPPGAWCATQTPLGYPLALQRMGLGGSRLPWPAAQLLVRPPLPCACPSAVRTRNKLSKTPQTSSG